MLKTDNLLSLKEVATYLGISKQSLYRMVKGGTIPAYKVGGTWRFRLSEIEEFLRRSSNLRGDRS